MKFALRTMLLCAALNGSLCFSQGLWWPPVVDGLDTNNIADAFPILDVMFVVSDSDLVDEKVIERDFSKLVPAAAAVKAGVPDRSTAKLIDELLTGPQRPWLRIASAIDCGDAGFMWHITWYIVPSVGGSSGTPIEYRAVVRADGTAVRPKLFLYNRYPRSVESKKALFSSILIDDLTPQTTESESIDKDKIRSAAETALKEALDSNNIETQFRARNITARTFPKEILDNDDSGNDKDKVVWEVEFVETTVPKESVAKVVPFTIWVTNDLLVSEISYGSWKAESRRIEK